MLSQKQIKQLALYLTYTGKQQDRNMYTEDSSGTLSIERAVAGCYGSKLWKNPEKREIRRRKSIIITDWVLYYYRKIPEDEMAFWQHLVENYDVYLWDGGEAALDQPIKSYAVLTQKLIKLRQSKTNPIDALKCSEQLQLWGKNPSTFEILDRTRVLEIAHQLKLPSYDTWESAKRNPKTERNYMIGEDKLKLMITTSSGDMEITLDGSNMLQINTLIDQLPFDDRKKITKIRIEIDQNFDVDQLQSVLEKLPNLENIEVTEYKPIRTAIERDLLHNNPWLFLEQFDLTKNIEHITQLKQLLVLKKNISFCDLTQYSIIFRKIKLCSDDIQEIPDLSTFQQLEEIDLSYCGNLVDLRGLAKCTNLRKITLLNCTQLPSLPDLSNLQQLEEIDLTGCKNLADISGLAKCTKLKRITLSKSTQLRSLSDLSSLQQLEEIDLRRCRNLVDISGLSKCTKLKRIVFCKFAQLKDFLDLSSLQQLEEIDLWECKNLVDISGLAKCTNLRRIALYKFAQLKDFPDLSNLQQLEEIDLWECENLVDISRLTKCTKLIKITLSCCTQLQGLPDLSNLQQLEEIRLHVCDNLVDISGLAKCTNLRKIDLSCCTQLRSLPDLSSLQQLEEIDLTECENLVDISGLAKCTKLRRVITKNSALHEQIKQVFKDREILFSHPFDRYVASTEFVSRSAPAPISYSTTDSSTLKTTDTFGIDGNTYTPPTTLPAKKLFIRANGSKPGPEEYRINVYNKFLLSQDQRLELTSVIQLDTEHDDPPFQPKLQSSPSITPGKLPENCYFAQVPLLLSSSTWTALPSLNIDDTLQILQESPPLEIKWCKATSQYLVRLKAASASADASSDKPVTLRYVMQSNHTERVSPQSRSQYPLPPEITEALSSLYQSLYKAYPLFREFTELYTDLNDPAVAISTKITMLKSYCHNFTNAALAPPPQQIACISKYHSDIQTMLNVILQRKGVCRHISQAFFVLANFFEIPCRWVENEIHAYVEFYDQGGWQKLDLGGGDAREIETIIQDTLPPILHPVDPQFALKLDTLHSRYLAFLNAKNLDEFRDAIFPCKNCLITLPQADLALALHAYFTRSIPGAIYIDKADDLHALLYRTINRGGQLGVADGPLTLLLQQSNGTLIINWSNFSLQEMATYKSLLDTPPTLHGRDIKTTLKIIGLLDAQKARPSEAFLSRWDIVTQLSPTVVNTLGAIRREQIQLGIRLNTQDTIPAKCISVNLYHGAISWKAILSGYLVRGQSGFERIPGVLDILDGQSLCLVDPPDDEELQHFLIEVRKSHPTLIIYYQNTADPQLSPIDAPSAPTRIYENTLLVNDATFPLLFPHNSFDDDNSIITLPGSLLLPNFTHILITSDLSKGQWLKLQDAIKERGLSLAIAALPNVKIDRRPFPTTYVNGTESATLQSALQAPALVINTNDISFALHEIASSTNDKGIITVPISETTTWADLVVRYEKSDKGGAELQFKTTHSEVWKKLLEGKTVVLYGAISQELYQKLESIFACIPPYLIVNGKKQPLNGKLVLVLPEACKVNSSKVHYQITANFDHYKEVLQRKYSTQLVDKLHKFYALVNEYLPQIAPQSPNLPLSLKRLEAMLDAIDHAHSNPKANPIRQCYLGEYPENSEAYAFLNVIAKWLFSTKPSKPPKLETLNALCEEIYKNIERCPQYFWRLANTFGVEEFTWLLKQTLGARDIEQLLQYLSTSERHHNTASYNLYKYCLTSLEKRISIRPNVLIAKQEQQINAFLDSHSQSSVILIGPPGVGKTFLTKKLQHRKDIDFYGSISELSSWLAPKSTPQKRVLVLDEFNLEPPEKWSFLHGLSQNPPIVFYQGNRYALTPEHKIIFIGNPYNYVERYKPNEELLAKIPTIIFKVLKCSQIEKVITPWFENIPGVNPTLSKELSEIFIAAYRFITTECKHLVISFRDLEMLYLRLYVHCQNDPEGNKKALALRVIWYEFAYNKKSEGKIQTFLEEQAKKYQIPLKMITTIPTPTPTISLLEKNRNFIITPSRLPFIALINENLWIRHIKIEQTNQRKMSLPLGKNGILLEGPSGAGKTELFVALLKACEMPFYQITAGSKNVEQILLEAFQKGMVVVLDELNLDPHLEELLGCLMTGEDMRGNKAGTPGFFVMASQNPVSYAGCSLLSSPLLDRFHCLSIPAYSEQEQRSIAEALGFTAQHARQLQKSCEKLSTNPRLFFRDVRDTSLRRVDVLAVDSI